MKFCVWFLLSLFLPFLYLTVSSDLSNRIVLTTSREDDPETWFDKENPQFEYIGQLWIYETRYIKAKIRQTYTKERISSLQEDPDVEILRQKPETTWVKQEKIQVRQKKTADPEWRNLWYLNDEVYPSMKVTEAWDKGYSGKGVIIAVVDDGLQTDHPDISKNIDRQKCVSFRDTKDRNDPNPKLEEDDHGTQVAGLIAAVKDNNICIPGVAFQSTIIGVQLLGIDDNPNNTVDSDEASALKHYLPIVDIYSNSWGATDLHGFIGPDKLTMQALRDGVTNGRKKKGTIYIFAAGNGGIDDNCNADGYANNKYTIAITGVQKGKNAYYSEVCAPALAATYGGSYTDRYLTTTNIDSGCISDDIGGTSFSTPIATGIVAMTLEANSELTWRDIQHLIVLCSSRKNFTDTFYRWSKNGANHEFSQVLGFGIMDAEVMVNMGSKWISVPKQYKCTSETNAPNLMTTTSASDSIYIFGKRCQKVKYLEHVEARITFSYTKKRGVTQLYLISPAGTKSILLHYRQYDQNATRRGILHWTYMSVHFWGEEPFGKWKLQISSKFPTVQVTLKDWKLTFYGTTTDPWQTTIYRVILTIETSAYQSLDNAMLNDQSSTKFKDIKAGLERYWSTKLGTKFYATTINRITLKEKNYINVDQTLYTRTDSVDSLIETCDGLVNGEESLTFGSILSLNATTASISIYEEPDNTVVISPGKNDLCSIRSTLSPCSSNRECETSNGKLYCASRESASKVDTQSIIGGVFGFVVLSALGAGLYTHKTEIMSLFGKKEETRNKTEKVKKSSTEEKGKKSSTEEQNKV